ncbi:MAG: SDR family oxidoreductase [Bacteroidetes bacterium]|nr:SDR family oxidoreductase [Bacteroidota bacterium]
MRSRLIITGASRGIGKSTALKFAGNQFDVAFCGRNKEDLSALENQLKSMFDGNFKGFVADLRDKQAVKEFGKNAIDFLGGCDVLVNNAGIFVPGSIENDEDGIFEDQLAINLHSYYHLTRAVLPALKLGKRPHIFNMCSIASIKAYPNGGSYCISKFAVYGLTKVLREELKPAHIGVTAILPGATLTESWGESTEPATRFMRTTDIADAIWAAYSINEHTVMEDIIMRPVAGDI